MQIYHIVWNRYDDCGEVTMSFIQGNFRLFTLLNILVAIGMETVDRWGIPYLNNMINKLNN